MSSDLEEHFDQREFDTALDILGETENLAKMQDAAKEHGLQTLQICYSNGKHDAHTLTFVTEGDFEQCAALSKKLKPLLRCDNVSVLARNDEERLEDNYECFTFILGGEGNLHKFIDDYRRHLSGNNHTGMKRK